MEGINKAMPLAVGILAIVIIAVGVRNIPTVPPEVPPVTKVQYA